MDQMQFGEIGETPWRITRWRLSGLFLSARIHPASRRELSMQENNSTWRIDLSWIRKKSYLSISIYRNAVATFFLHSLHAMKRRLARLPSRLYLRTNFPKLPRLNLRISFPKFFRLACSRVISGSSHLRGFTSVQISGIRRPAFYFLMGSTSQGFHIENSRNLSWIRFDILNL